MHYTEMGGAERLIVDITGGIDRTKFEPMVCLLVPLYKYSVYKDAYPAGSIESAASEATRLFEAIDVPVLLLPMASKYGPVPVAKLLRILRRESIDVLFFTDMQPERTIGLVAGVLTRRVATVLSCHYDPSDDKRERTFNRLERALLPFAARLTATSRYHKEGLVRGGGVKPGKIEVIYNGLDAQRFARRAGGVTKSDLGIPSSSMVVGVVARLVPRKDHSTFLQAAARILTHGMDVYFLVIGDGKERQRLERMAEDLGIDERVVFLGAREDVPDLIRLLDVGVLCPLSEIFGIALIEYMVNAKPVVASSVGGIPEVVVDGRTGILVNKGNPDLLAERIMDVLADPDLGKRLGQAGRERALRHFVIARTVSSLESVFLSLARRRSTSGPR
jgi:glycosyltransferase involved in cell wall biosynthesis